MGKKQRQKQQRGAGHKPHHASGKVDICMTCLRGEEWCFEVGKVGHVSPDYYHSPPQEEEVELEPQPQEEVGWEALLHSMGVQYCCYICGEWGHFPANCPLPPEECLLPLHPPLPPAEGESLLVPPPPAKGGCLLVPFPPAEGSCLLVPPLPPKGEEPLPPSPPEGEEPLPPSPPEGEEPPFPPEGEEPLPPLPSRGEEQELPLPPTPPLGEVELLLPSSWPGAPLPLSLSPGDASSPSPGDASSPLPSAVCCSASPGVACVSFDSPRVADGPASPGVAEGPPLPPSPPEGPLSPLPGVTAGFAWGRCQPFMAAGNTVAGATQRGATGYEEGGGGEETTSTTAPTTTPVP
ncbi:UNVERIFIED_CONTAM: hypothetical protein FKN15_053086 [Acipenser sinensis]